MRSATELESRGMLTHPLRVVPVPARKLRLVMRVDAALVTELAKGEDVVQADVAPSVSPPFSDLDNHKIQ